MGKFLGRYVNFSALPRILLPSILPHYFFLVFLRSPFLPPPSPTPPLTPSLKQLYFVFFFLLHSIQTTFSLYNIPPTLFPIISISKLSFVLYFIIFHILLTIPTFLSLSCKFVLFCLFVFIFHFFQLPLLSPPHF